MNTKFKLMMISEGYGRGGGDRVISELSLNLPPEIDIVIAAVKIETPENQFPYRGRLLELPVKNSSFRFIWRTIEISKAINKEKPDIVLTFRQNFNFANLISLGNHRRVVSFHNYDSKYLNTKGLKGYINKKMTNYLFTRADLIIVLTESMKKDLISLFDLKEEKISVIPNPINIKMINELSKEKVNNEFFDTEVPIIINIGRFTKQKGQWHLIRAFYELQKEIDCKLVFLGDGHLGGYLKKLVSDYGIEKKVLFLGWQKNPFKYLANSDIFVLSSLWEGFPLALVEAMAIGIPVISTNCKYGPSDILNNGEFGKLIPVFDGSFYNSREKLTKEEEILKDSLKEILSSESARYYYSQVGRNRAKEFETKKIIDMYMEKFISLL